MSSSNDAEESYESYSTDHLSHSSSMDFLTYRQKHAEYRRMKEKQDEYEESSFYGTYSTYDDYSEDVSSSRTGKSDENSDDNEEPSDPYFHKAIKRQKAIQDIFHKQILSFRTEVEALRRYPDARFLHEGMNAGLNSVEYNCQNRYVQEAIRYDYQLGYDRAFLIRTELMDKYKAELGENVLMQMIYMEMRKVIPQMEINRGIERAGNQKEPNEKASENGETDESDHKANENQLNDKKNEEKH